MRFYVYELREEGGAVFYVGKGTGDRLNDHARRAFTVGDTFTHRKIRKLKAQGIGVRAVKVFETDDESEALREEVRRIALYGRESLTNLTDGGDGTSGCKWREESRRKLAATRCGMKPDEATRLKLVQSHKGKRQTDETKEKRAAKLRGRKRSPEVIARVAAALRGKPVSAERRQKISATLKGRKVGTPSEEHRQKLAEATRAWWARKKAA